MPASDVTIRMLAADDVDAAVAVFAAVAAEGRWIGTEPGVDTAERAERWRATLAAPTHRSLGAFTRSGEIVGNAGADLAPYGVAEIGMAVAEGWRGRGVGGLLLDAVVDASRQMGAHKVSLHVWPHNARALALYRSRGFTEEGRLVRHYRRRSGELWDAIVMGLVLDDDAPPSPFGDDPLVS